MRARDVVIVGVFVACSCGDAADDPNPAATSGATDGGSDSGGGPAGGTMTSEADDGAETDADGETTATATTAVETGDPQTGGETTAADGTTGPASGCAAGDYIVCEDFEAAPLDGFPDGWGLRTSGVWGGNTIGVTDEDAADGSQSLKIQSGPTGAQWMAYMGDISGLANGHWGRMRVRMGTPIPWPQAGVIHGDLFEARGNWNGSTHQVRWAVIENTAMKHNWGYNVQTSNAGEFIFETGYDYDWPADWFCIEWHHDQGAQEATLWVDGVQTLAVVSDQDPQLPTFDDISVGWAHYQEASPEFTVYLDDVVLDDERVGCP